MSGPSDRTFPSRRRASELSDIAVTRALGQACRLSDVGLRSTAFYLHEMQSRGLYVDSGHSSAVEFAMRELDIEPSRARELLAIGAALDRLPLIDDSFCAGRIDWSQVRKLVRVATPETEAEWLERAGGMIERDGEPDEPNRPVGDPADARDSRVISVDLDSEAFARWLPSNAKP